MSRQRFTPGHLLVATESLEPRRHLSAGDIDPAFANQGRLALPLAPTMPILNSAGGRIIVFPFNEFSGSNSFQRRNADGSLDTTFGSNGAVNYPFESPVDAEMLPDGKFLLMGQQRSLVDGKIEHPIARFNANGTLDTTFGDSGIANPGEIAGTDSGAALALQPDGHILVRREVEISGRRELDLWRLNSSGALDNFFRFTYSGDPGPVEVQADGKVLIGGRALRKEGVSFTLVRLNSNGSIDTAFANSGYFNSAPVDSLAIQEGTSRRIHIGFTSGSGPFNNGEMSIARLLDNGAVDSTFGQAVAGSIHQSRLTFGNYGFFTRMLSDPDGRILVFNQRSLARLNADGSLDSTFGRLVTLGAYDTYKGTPILDNPQGAITIHTLAVQPDGHVLVAGSDGPANPTGYLYRLQNDTDAQSDDGTFSLSGGALSITGTDAEDAVQFELNTSRDDLIVRVAHGFGRVFEPAQVTHVLASLGAGNDRFYMHVFSAPATISGADGDDTLLGGSAGDSITGGEGADQLWGGPGNDTILGNGQRDRIRGDSGDDTLHGGPSADSLYGDGGSDHVFGDGGNDRIAGGQDPDSLEGGAGLDTFLTLDNAIDQIIGGRGFDSAVADDDDLLTSIEQVLA